MRLLNLAIIFFIVSSRTIKSIKCDYERKLCLFGPKIPICQVCCCEDLATINCNDLRSDFYSNKRPIILDIDETYFNGIQKTLSHLVIDFTSSDVNFKIDHGSFINMINLQSLTLTKINEITHVPRLENQIHLEELTIQSSNLKHVSSDFCLTNSRLKKIDFSYNEFESNNIRNVFTNCDHLILLDMSYNNLDSLENFITYVSSLALLNLDNNKIQKINSNDLDFLIDLNELTLVSNNIQVIHENAFYSLNKLVKLDLRNNKLEEFNDHDMVNLEFIDLSFNQLKKINNDFCLNKINLKTILFSNNRLKLKNLAGIFDSCISLVKLALDNNEINSISGLFNQSLKIHKINLNNNKITEIRENDFKYLINLEHLSLSGNLIKFIDEKSFDSIKHLKTLDLSRNKLILLPETSVAYGTLEEFDISENNLLVEFPDVNQFRELLRLKVHHPYHCCQFEKKTWQPKHSKLIENETDDSDIIVYDNNYTINQTVAILQDNEIDQGVIIADPIDHSESEITIVYHKDSKEKHESFLCTPEPDPFQPCENLLEGWWLRSSVWFISLMGILSNLIVVAFNILYIINYYYSNVAIHVPAFLLTNLAVADSLMSIYLLFIAIKDNTSRSHFGKSALEWQNSFSCNLAGFLSISSTVSSALCLVFITFERYYAIKNSINFNKRITFKFAIFICVLIWFIAFTFSFLPLVDINSYSRYAICLPLDTRGNSYQAYVIGLNSMFIISFIFMCIFYAMVFINTSFRKRKTSISECNDQLKMRSVEDQRLARNILLLLTVNIICWGPIVLFCFYSIFNDNTMNRTYLKLIAVFIIPFNSLINPFLYCLSRKIFRTFIRDYFAKYRLKRNLATNLSVKSTYSSYSCKRSSHKSSIINSIHRNSNTEKI